MTELRELHIETVYEITHWFEKRLKDEYRAPAAWKKILRLVFFKKPDAKLGKGLRGFRAVALMSVLFKMVCSSSGGTLARFEGAGGMGEACTRAPRGRVNCEDMLSLLTNMPQRHWEWQEDRRGAWIPGSFTWKTAFVASFDVKTVFEVTMPSVVSKTLTLTETHEWQLCWRRRRT